MASVKTSSKSKPAKAAAAPAAKRASKSGKAVVRPSDVKPGDIVKLLGPISKLDAVSASKKTGGRRSVIAEFGTFGAAKPAKKGFRVGMPASNDTKLSASTLTKIAARLGVK